MGIKRAVRPITIIKALSKCSQFRQASGLARSTAELQGEGHVGPGGQRTQPAITHTGGLIERQRRAAVPPTAPTGGTGRDTREVRRLATRLVGRQCVCDNEYKLRACLFQICECLYMLLDGVLSNLDFVLFKNNTKPPLFSSPLI